VHALKVCAVVSMDGVEAVQLGVLPDVNRVSVNALEAPLLPAPQVQHLPALHPALRRQVKRFQRTDSVHPTAIPVHPVPVAVSGVIVELRARIAERDVRRALVLAHPVRLRNLLRLRPRLRVRNQPQPLLLPHPQLLRPRFLSRLLPPRVFELLPSVPNRERLR
jgi:hypothetical protein